MLQIPPSAWTAVSVILGAFGVAYTPSDAAKATIGAAAGLVVAVWQWQHHRTKRAQIAATLELAGKKLDVQAQTVQADQTRAELAAQTDHGKHAVSLVTDLTRDVSGLMVRLRGVEAKLGLTPPLAPPPAPVPAGTVQVDAEHAPPTPGNLSTSSTASTSSAPAASLNAAGGVQ